MTNTNSNATLDALRVNLDKTDRHLVALVAKRLDLVRKIEKTKHANGHPILAEETEQGKLSRIGALANKKGLSLPFVQSLFYGLFSESCRAQAKQRDERGVPASLPKEDDDRYARLKQNLLELTSQLVPEFKHTYNLDSFGTVSYMEFEQGVVKTEVGTLTALGSSDLAVDLGCGVGNVSFDLTSHFEQVKGFDISPSMIKQANWTRFHMAGDLIRTSFGVLDIEEGLPLEDNSVSFVVMGLGTASDIRNLRRVLASIKRVLKKDGRFVLSFYNSAALFYRWSLPWQVDLMAEIDPINHCLNVRLGDKTFELYARPYTKREVKSLLTKEGFRISSLYTYPALAAILPNELFYGAEEAQKASHRKEVRTVVSFEEETRKNIQQIDKGLVNSDMGAYILVTGRKD